MLNYKLSLHKNLGSISSTPPNPVKAQKQITISPAVWCQCDAHLLKESHVKIWNIHKLIHCELLVHFEKYPHKFNMQTHTVGDHNIIGIIKMHIKQLTAEAQLKKLDDKFKKKYADGFPSDIPHICDLPWDVYHHIEVKPGATNSTTHTYSCPHK